PGSDEWSAPIGTPSGPQLDLESGPPVAFAEGLAGFRTTRTGTSCTQTLVFVSLLDLSGRQLVALPCAGSRALVSTPRWLVVWGGRDNSSGAAIGDGFQVSAATKAVIPLPPAPVAARFSFASSATGARVLFWGGLGNAVLPLADGAAYDPERMEWARLPTDGAPASASAGFWLGAGMLVIGFDPLFTEATGGYLDARLGWTLPWPASAPPISALAR